MTYDLAIQMVFLNHNNVHRLGVLESQETEASRSTGGTVSHDGALRNLAKLREVFP